MARHPDYMKFEQDVAQFINTDPDMSQRYPRLFAVDPVAAWELAFMKFGESRRAAVGGQNGLPPADSALPTSRSGDGRRPPTADAESQAAFERWQKTGSTGDAAAYAKTRLHGVIKDEFLNQ